MNLIAMELRLGLRSQPHTSHHKSTLKNALEVSHLDQFILTPYSADSNQEHS